MPNDLVTPHRTALHFCVVFLLARVRTHERTSLQRRPNVRSPPDRTPPGLVAPAVFLALHPAAGIAFEHRSRCPMPDSATRRCASTTSTWVVAFVRRLTR